MPTLNWITIRDFLANQIHINPKLLEYIAVYNILEGCATGLSNREIAEINDYTLGYVQAAIIEFLHVYGWEETLYANPLTIYRTANGNRQVFNFLYRNEDPYIKITEVTDYYTACLNFDKISKTIEEYYDRKTT